MREKIKATKTFLLNTSVKQRIIAGVVVFVLVVGGATLIYNNSKSVSAKSDVVTAKNKKLEQHLKADKDQKAKSDEQAKAKAKIETDKKAEADKQAKLKAEAAAKAKADSEAKAKAEAEKAQQVQAEQQQAQAQAVAEQQAQQAQVVQQQDNQVAPSYVAPQNNTGGATNVTPAPTPNPAPAPISDEQKWLNAGYIRAPYPEGSNELWLWLDAHNYSGYTGNGEGWIRPY